MSEGVGTVSHIHSGKLSLCESDSLSLMTTLVKVRDRVSRIQWWKVVTEERLETKSWHWVERERVRVCPCIIMAGLYTHLVTHEVTFAMWLVSHVVWFVYVTCGMVCVCLCVSHVVWFVYVCVICGACVFVG